ncbi:MAG: hypothetical protein BMS9Abin33_1140 [Gammaproteobacteria bacterium]|nr:MAG: hypothetical protein BMS9Abin33_1140 [Gammaproteobacteria bacterium]
MMTVNNIAIAAPRTILLGLVASAVFFSFLDKKTIAEYVENDDIPKKLREVGVNYAQGFGITCPEIIKEEMPPGCSLANVNKAKLLTAEGVEVGRG